MKISKYQFIKETINEVSYDDFHQAVEDEMAIFKYNDEYYVVVEIYSLLENNVHPHIVFKYDGKLIEVEMNEDVVKNVLSQYENSDI